MTEEPSNASVKGDSQARDYSPCVPRLLESPPIISDFYTLGICGHPGMSLVFVPLTPSNYLGWSDDIMNNLIAKSKEGFISGTLPKPNPIEPEYKFWIKKRRDDKGMN